MAPLKVTLDGTASQDPDGSIANYAWAWNGGSATGSKADIVLPAGTFDITLTVRDNLGKTAKDVVRIQVDPATDPPTDVYWLEAECAAVGTNWTSGSSSSASGGKYVVSTRSSMSGPPNDVAANRVRFTVNNVQAGSYNLFARVLAPNTGADSYWVRVNGGSWFAWNSGITTGSQFAWNRYIGNDFPALRSGTNTIDFAFREAGTRLDKLFLSPSADLPSGTGGAAANCGTAANQAPVARATVSATSGVAPLTITLDGSKSSDADGSITAYNWTWPGGKATGKQAAVTLGQGTYPITLTVTDDDGAQGTNVVTVAVSAEPGTDPPTDPKDDFWLEAECAAVGAKWSVKADGSASNGSYVVVEKGNAYSSPPSDVADNRVRFTFSTAAAGTYRLFARVLAASGLDDSFYVRVNGGTWYSWDNGLSGSSGFAWQEYGKGLLNLKSGTNTIDFAYREDGTKLDKLYLTPGATVPSGYGGVDDNCGDLADDGSDEWLETECGDLASGWTTVNSPAASNGSYIVYNGPRNLNVPGDADTDRKAYFTVDVIAAGNYHLFLRLDAPSDDDNSVWVRVDDGKWMKMWKDAAGNNLLTNGFEWHKVNDDGKNVVFNLPVGQHTITLANRESGTMLDKLNLSLSSTLPVGEGVAALNCIPDQSAQLSPATKSAAAVAEDPTDLRVFPNPVLEELTVNYHAAQEGIIELEIYDVNGRVVRSLRREKSGPQLSTRLSVSDLGAGMYHLRVVGRGRPLIVPFVKQ